MIVHSDKDGVLAATRKAFDREIRALYRVADCIPEVLPSYELLGHYADDGGPCAAYFRRLTGRGDDFGFAAYLAQYCETLKRLGIWRKFPYNGAMLYLLERLRDAAKKRGEDWTLRVVTASGTNPEDRELVNADTRLWLAQGGLSDAELVNDTKKERYLDCDLWIEDMPVYIVKIMKAGFRGRALLFDAPCNKDHALRHALTAEQFSRVRRIYPSLEVLRSCPPVRADILLSLGGENAHQRALRARADEILARADERGLTIAPDPNHLPDLLEGPPALAFMSEEVNDLVSLVGTDAATAILTRNASRLLEVTSARASGKAERRFLAERTAAFKAGSPLYLHFAFRNNEHLYNCDVVEWTARFAKAFRKAATLAPDREGLRFHAPLAEPAVAAFLKRAFVRRALPEPFEERLAFFDGAFCVRCAKGTVTVSCEGPRAAEARGRVEALLVGR